jgi:uncharacterized protein YcfL
MMNKIFFLSILVFALVGCTTTKRTNVETVAFKTLNATATTVHSIMAAYADVYVQGKVTEAQHRKISNLHDHYRALMRLAIASAQFDTSQPTPKNVVDVASELIHAISELL